MRSPASTGPAIEDDDLRDTIALVVELDYYGILGYVVPKQVREEVDQWAKDFVDVFSVEQYHHQVARLWVDSLAREADVAGFLRLVKFERGQAHFFVTRKLLQEGDRF